MSFDLDTPRSSFKSSVSSRSSQSTSSSAITVYPNPKASLPQNKSSRVLRISKLPRNIPQHEVKDILSGCDGFEDYGFEKLFSGPRRAFQEIYVLFDDYTSAMSALSKLTGHKFRYWLESIHVELYDPFASGSAVDISTPRGRRWHTMLHEKVDIDNVSEDLVDESKTQTFNSLLGKPFSLKTHLEYTRFPSTGSVSELEEKLSSAYQPSVTAGTQRRAEGLFSQDASSVDNGNSEQLVSPIEALYNPPSTRSRRKRRGLTAEERRNFCLRNAGLVEPTAPSLAAKLTSASPSPMRLLPLQRETLWRPSPKTSMSLETKEKAFDRVMARSSTGSTCSSSSRDSTESVGSLASTNSSMTDRFKLGEREALLEMLEVPFKIPESSPSRLRPSSPERVSLANRTSRDLLSRMNSIATDHARPSLSTHRYQCTFAPYSCTFTTDSRHEWLRHQRVHHYDSCELVWYYDKCPSMQNGYGLVSVRKSFVQEDQFFAHMRETHPDCNAYANGSRDRRGDPFICSCPFCDEQFAGPDTWDRRMGHIAVHFQLAPHNNPIRYTTEGTNYPIWKQDPFLEEYLLLNGIIQKPLFQPWKTISKRLQSSANSAKIANNQYDSYQAKRGTESRREDAKSQTHEKLCEDISNWTGQKLLPTISPILSSASNHMHICADVADGTMRRLTKLNLCTIRSLMAVKSSKLSSYQETSQEMSVSSLRLHLLRASSCWKAISSLPNLTLKDAYPVLASFVYDHFGLITSQMRAEYYQSKRVVRKADEIEYLSVSPRTVEYWRQEACQPTTTYSGAFQNYDQSMPKPDPAPTKLHRFRRFKRSDNANNQQSETFNTQTQNTTPGNSSSWDKSTTCSSVATSDGQHTPTRSSVGHVSNTSISSSDSSSLYTSSSLEASSLLSCSSDTDSSTTTSEEFLLDSFISARSRLIDRLMKDLHLVFHSIPPLQSCAGTQNAPSTPSQNKQSNRQNTNQARIQRLSSDKGGKRRQDGDDGDQDDDESQKRRKKELKEPFFESPESIQLRFACPFFKRNPRRHKGRACRYPGFRGVHRVKEHLYRCHVSIHCNRCHIILQTEAELQNHQRQIQPCVISGTSPPEGLGATQIARLKSKKRFGSERTEEERWRAIYHFLFPDDPVMSISPYCDDLVEPTEGNDLDEFEIFSRREFPRRLHQMLDALYESLDIDDTLRAQLANIASQCRDEIYSAFQQDRDEPMTTSNAEMGPETEISPPQAELPSLPNTQSSTESTSSARYTELADQYLRQLHPSQAHNLHTNSFYPNSTSDTEELSPPSASLSGCAQVGLPNQPRLDQQIDLCSKLVHPSSTDSSGLSSLPAMLPFSGEMALSTSDADSTMFAEHCVLPSSTDMLELGNFPSSSRQHNYSDKEMRMNAPFAFDSTHGDFDFDSSMDLMWPDMSSFGGLPK